MSQRLRILHLEDEPDYSQFVRDLLKKEGIEADLLLVCDRKDFDAALEREEFDLILADYSLPTWTGIQALGISRDKAPQTPFLLVSGTIGEQVAIESLHAGATDYVLKQWPDRLIPAVRRALREAEERARRRQAETELVRREKYFRAMIHNSLDVVSVLSREGFFQYNSPSLKRVLGYDPAEFVGKSVFGFVHPDDRMRVEQAFQRALAQPGFPVPEEFRFRHQQGHWVPLESVGQNCLDDPDIAAVIVNSRDISVRKRIEHQRAALSKLGRQLSSVTSASEAAKIIQAVADELFGWDVFMLDLYLAETDDIQPVLDMDTIDGKRIEFHLGNPTHKPSGVARRIIEKGAELILRDKPTGLMPDAVPFGDTSRPSASLMFVPVRNGANVIGVLSIHSYTPRAYARSDLDTLQAFADYCGGALERIRAEQAFRESEQRFGDLFEGSPEAIFVEDLAGNVLDANPAACNLHRVVRNQLIGKNIRDLVPAERESEVAAGFKKLAAGEITRIEGESLSADGRVTPVEIHAARISYAGKPAVLLHVRDVSERKRAEAAMRSSEMLFHSVWENSVDGMRLTDENGVIVAVNDAYCDLVGMDRADLEGKVLTIIYAGEEERDRILKRYHERFQGRIIQRQSERILTLHNGNTLTLENTNSFVELRGQPPLLLGLFRNITAHKRLEEQLRQSQKMDAIGQLAGGVAHDFNNMLTVIHGHASMIHTGVSPDGMVANSAQQIVQASERAAGLTRQLLTFSRRQVMQPRRLDMNEVVSNMTKMLGRILGEDIRLRVNYWPQPAFVDADASMMEQVVLNLSVNARDAMPDGGQLDIEIAMVDTDDSYVAEHPEARTGRFVCFTTTDTGCGIAPENMRRIFEPFFTTKEVGKGTGLGLATVYGVVKQHQGWIELESEVDRGSTFKVHIPGSEGASDIDEQEPTELVVHGGTETILIVEDEYLVRALVSTVLKGHGYQILEAETGAKALEIWRTDQDRIDLVLTDLVMPDQMNGRELAEKLWKDRPDLRVIFTSGYNADVVGKQFVIRRGTNYLQKPYEPQRLAMTVRQCLDADGANGP